MSSTSRHCRPLPVQFARLRWRSMIGLTNGSRSPLAAGLRLASALLAADCGAAGLPLACRGAALLVCFPLTAGAGVFGEGDDTCPPLGLAAAWVSGCGFGGGDCAHA